MTQKFLSISFGIVLLICAADAVSGTSAHPTIPSTNAVISAFIANLDAEDREADQKLKASIPAKEDRFAELQKKYARCLADRCMELSGTGGVWVDREDFERYGRNAVGYLSHDACQKAVAPQCESMSRDAQNVRQQIEDARNGVLHLRSADWVFYTDSIKNYEGTIIAVIGTRRKGSDHSYDWKVTMHMDGSSLIVDKYACVFEENGTGNETCYKGGTLK